MYAEVDCALVVSTELSSIRERAMHVGDGAGTCRRL